MFENFIDRVNKKFSTDFDFSEIQITFKKFTNRQTKYDRYGT